MNDVSAGLGGNSEAGHVSEWTLVHTSGADGRTAEPEVSKLYQRQPDYTDQMRSDGALE